MTTSPGESETPPISLYQVYAAELRDHAIMLIWLGYQRISPSSLASAHEDDITGELIRHMKLVAEDPSSPDWVDRYEIHEQSRQNVPGKLGKNRPIMDIQIERHQRGPRPCLGFEAKPLGRGKDNTIGAYLGDEGLAAFFSRYYPTTHGEAGMLGYVLEKTIDDWTTQLAEAITRNARKLRVAANTKLELVNVSPSTPAYRSVHTDEAGKPLVVTHVLLSFVG